VYHINEDKPRNAADDVPKQTSASLYLAAALVEYPVLAGRVRIKKQIG